MDCCRESSNWPLLYLSNKNLFSSSSFLEGNGAWHEAAQSQSDVYNTKRHLLFCVEQSVRPEHPIPSHAHTPPPQSRWSIDGENEIGDKLGSPIIHRLHDFYRCSDEICESSSYQKDEGSPEKIRNKTSGGFWCLTIESLPFPARIVWKRPYELLHDNHRVREEGPKLSISWMVIGTTKKRRVKKKTKRSVRPRYGTGHKCQEKKSVDDRWQVKSPGWTCPIVSII